MDHWLCVYDNITFIDDALPQADQGTASVLKQIPIFAALFVKEPAFL